MRIGILAGTGAPHLEGAQDILVETRYGDRLVQHAARDGLDLFFVSRHAAPDARVLPPHRIAHRANVDALARCKVDAVFAVNAVGALADDLAVPSLLVPDDLLDLRKTTETFFDDAAVHVDLSEPYCPTLRALLARHAGARDGGTYVAVEGPRLETRAEVRAARQLGGHVIGMTGAPEAALARERAICYASLCLVVNAAAGVQPGALSASAIREGAAALAPAAMRAVLAAAREVRAERACGCRAALAGARM